MWYNNIGTGRKLTGDDIQMKQHTNDIPCVTNTEDNNDDDENNDTLSNKNNITGASDTTLLAMRCLLWFRVVIIPWHWIKWYEK